ncbi:MAG: triose-phosphate isomerase [Mycobacteriales bacterium]
MPPRRTPLIAGNWKMNYNHLEAIAHVEKLAYLLSAQDLADREVALLPPFTDLRSVQTVVDGERLLFRYGAQDLSAHPNGAHTGEVSAAMLAKLGCSYVVVGHSERRADHAESDALVAAKAHAAVAAGITPIVCVGEGLELRRAGEHVAYTTASLRASTKGLDGPALAGLVVAYEPVWAIGTGEVATPRDAQEVCTALRKTVAAAGGAEAASKIRILYGGSVKAASATAIMSEADVDGLLVGGASLDAEEFAAIVRFGR